MLFKLNIFPFYITFSDTHRYKHDPSLATGFNHKLSLVRISEIHSMSRIECRM